MTGSLIPDSERPQTSVATAAEAGRALPASASASSSTPGLLDFGVQEAPRSLWRDVRRPIIGGFGVLGFFIAGSITWAAVSPMASAVLGQGVVRVDENRKTIKHRDGGIIRDILIREGETVAAGQELFQLDNTAPKANVAVLRSAYNAALVQHARFSAERDGLSAVALPKELDSQRDDPSVAILMRDQSQLFGARKAAFERQTEVLAKRVDQLRTRITGLQAQVSAYDRQIEYIRDELQGVESLFEKSLVPKTRVRALQRAAAELEGNRGASIAEIARTEEAIGETEIQAAQLRQQRAAEIGEGLRDSQARISDALPRLTTALEILDQTRITAPVAGFVLNLTQFTQSGVIAAGEKLLDIVPTDSPLVFETRIRPDEAYEVLPGMKARVQLATFESRQLPPLDGEVRRISADRIVDQRTGEPYFAADVSISPDALKQYGDQLRVYPGMSATVMIATGERTVLDYLISPVRDSLRSAMRER